MQQGVETVEQSALPRRDATTLLDLVEEALPNTVGLVAMEVEEGGGGAVSGRRGACNSVSGFGGFNQLIVDEAPVDGNGLILVVRSNQRSVSDGIDGDLVPGQDQEQWIAQGGDTSTSFRRQLSRLSADHLTNTIFGATCDLLMVADGYGVDEQLV